MKTGTKKPEAYLKRDREIYLYAAHYHQEHVKCVLIRENWSGKDYDYKYADYLKDFLRTKEVTRDRSLNEDHLKGLLTQMSQRRVQETYQWLFDQFINRVRETRSISDQAYDGIKEKLQRFHKKAEFDEDYLRAIRTLEEYIYDTNGEIS